MISDRTETHIVKEGETLYLIAQKYGVTLEALKEANPGIDPELITIGQEINIPEGNNGGESPSSKTHTVRDGETLSTIAKQYGVTLEALKEANPNINPEIIVVGQRINIPE